MTRYLATPVLVLIQVACAGAAACRTSSDYDLTLADAALQFERKTAPAQTIEMRQGMLAINRHAVALGADDRNRVLAFETKVRDLVPRVKALGTRSVDLMASAIRDEAQRASPGSAADPELNARLDARAQELKRRIAQSRTSKEWRPEALNGYVTGAIADVAPLLTGDLSQKAVDLTMKGDLTGVLALSNEALALKQSLEQHVRERLATLQPAIDRLCPALRELDRLESGVRAARLNLIDFQS